MNCEEWLSFASIYESRPHTPPQLKRCVVALASKDTSSDPREATSRAFAICTAQLQKYGYLKDKTQQATKKGKKAGKTKAAQKDHVEKIKAYEKLLKQAREQ